MIKAAVRRQQQKMAGVMAVIALGVRRRVKLGFTDGEHAVVAFAAAPEHFSMIHRVGGGKSQALGTMTGRAHIAGSNVGRRLTRNVAESVAMAVHAVRRQPIVKGTGFRWHGRHNQLNSALAGDPLGADDQLGDVGAAGISNEAGVLKGCVQQFSIAGIGPRGEGPLKAQGLRRRRQRFAAVQRGGLAHPHGNDRPGSGYNAGDTISGGRLRQGRWACQGIFLAAAGTTAPTAGDA